MFHHHHHQISLSSWVAFVTILLLINNFNPTLARPIEDEQPEISTEQPITEPTTTILPTTKSDFTVTSDLPDVTSFKNTSTFTCYGRPTGYYADVKLACQVYHFCTQMESIGDTQYQRMSYICLEGSIFDQSSLNCVADADLKVPCEQAESQYDTSNKQFDQQQDSQPSYSDSLAANIMMNPITRYIAG